MAEMFVVVALGFVLGMRHATDADHVVAVTAIVARQRDISVAALTGLLWGVGHTLTLFCVGSAIILFNVVIPVRVAVGMEMSVGVMLIVLGAANMAAYAKVTPHAWWRSVRGSRRVRAHAHGHQLERSRTYALVRPVVVGVVHGLAGSAAVTLLVVAAVRDPRWAIANLLVFGVGTIAGMMLITMSVASAMRLAGGGSEPAARRLALGFGLATVIFGAVFVYRVW